MSFVAKKVASFKWPVSVSVPNDGKYESHTFTAVFKSLKKSEIDSLENDDAKFIKGVLLGWEDVLDENNEEIPFNKENLAAMIDDIRWSVAVIRTYYKCINDVVEKN
jgi:hypothetical protein